MFKAVLVALMIGLPLALVQSADAKKMINESHPRLASGCLTFAFMVDLPDGSVLKSGETVIAEKELADETTKAPTAIQEQMKKNQFFLLEQISTRRLLLAAAKAAPGDGEKTPAATDDKQIQEYVERGIGPQNVTDEEIAEFYAQNGDMCGGVKLDSIKDDLKQYILNQKRQKAAAKFIKTLGQRMEIQVSAAWAEKQAVLAADNLVDKARASGKPSLVDFGSKGCRPCDMLAPILETLVKKYEGKVNIMFVSVVEQQILAARYEIDSIPAQIFFDKDGNEVYRHVGFIPQEQIEKKLAEMKVELP
jgi:thiol-disulfide isomerase/thioredoxin